MDSKQPYDQEQIMSRGENRKTHKEIRNTGLKRQEILPYSQPSIHTPAALDPEAIRLNNPSFCPEMFSGLASSEREAVRKSNAEQALHELRFIDSLMYHGEEPYEIDLYVKKAAESAALAFIAELHGKGILADPRLVKVMIVHLYTLQYLERWKPNGTLSRIFKPTLRQYFDEMPFEHFSEPLAGLTAFEVLTLFFRSLREWGYELDVERLERAVTCVGSEFRHRIFRASTGARTPEEAGYGLPAPEQSGKERLH